MANSGDTGDPDAPLDGLAIARQRIAEEAEARTGFLDLGMLGLTSLPEELFGLTHLRRLNLGIGWTNENGFWLLSSRNKGPNYVESSLERLAELSELQALFVRACRLTDLASLAGLTALQELDFANTHVNNLIPLAGLRSLRSLDCSENLEITDLTPLAGLANLKSLNCRGTQVKDLSPLAGITALQLLDCSATQVSDLAPLTGLAALEWLQCSGCTLIDVPRWLVSNSSLRTLILCKCHLPGVPVETLSQSYGENCLYSLRAHVRDLEAGTVPVRDVKLMVLGNGLVGKTQLCRRLRDEPFDAAVPSTHGVLVTRAPLPAGEGDAPVNLQIWDFGGQDIYHGTHALFMRTNAIFLLMWTPALEDTCEHAHGGFVFRNYPLAYWVDYVRHLGGGDSPVLVVQARCDRPEDEAACPVPEAELFKAFAFRKVLHHSARTDRGRAALAEALGEAAAWLREREGIAVIGAGRARVQQRLEAMRDADASVREPEARQYRTITQDHFRRLCDEEGGVSSPDHLLSYLHHAGIVFYQQGLFGDAIILDQGWALDAIYAVFHRDTCARHIRNQQGRFTRADLDDWVWRALGHGIEEQKLFLSMMRSCGICFELRRFGPAGDEEAEYIAPDLLPERADMELRLEQTWEPDQPTETATFTYALLHPGLIRSIISRIGQQAGLAAEYWKGGVYVYDRTTRSRGLIEQQMDATNTWRGSIRIQTQSRQPAAGPATLLLSQLATLVEHEQNRAGMTPVEFTSTASPAGHSGARTAGAGTPGARGRDGSDLTGPLGRDGLGIPGAHDRDGADIPGAHGRAGPDAIGPLDRSLPHAASAAPGPDALDTTGAPGRTLPGVTAVTPGADIPPLSQPKYGQEPASAPEWCVSYAWNDTTPEGRDRAVTVDTLCAEAERRGIHILRDKTDMGLGERISKFMKRIGAADRVFVVLSDKYLKSPFCMFELSEVWRTSRQKDEEFRERIRVYTLPCAKFSRPVERAAYAIYWKGQYEELETLVKTHGYDILGERDAQEFRRMKEFSRNVGDILAAVADTLQPQTFDDLVSYGFND